MKLLVFFLATLCVNVQTLNIDAIRLAYKLAAHDSDKVTSFSELTAKVTKKDKPVLVAYKGASLTLLARQAKTIKEKKEGFIDGVAWLNHALEREPNNVEIRFIRIGIQENTPKILKYKGNIEEDKHFILKQFNQIQSSTLKADIKDYILQSKVFTDDEKSLISRR